MYTTVEDEAWFGPDDNNVLDAIWDRPLQSPLQLPSDDAPLEWKTFPPIAHLLEYVPFRPPSPANGTSTHMNDNPIAPVFDARNEAMMDPYVAFASRELALPLPFSTELDAALLPSIQSLLSAPLLTQYNTTPRRGSPLSPQRATFGGLAPHRAAFAPSPPHHVTFATPPPPRRAAAAPPPPPRHAASAPPPPRHAASAPPPQQRAAFATPPSPHHAAFAPSPPHHAAFTTPPPPRRAAAAPNHSAPDSRPTTTLSAPFMYGAQSPRLAAQQIKQMQKTEKNHAAAELTTAMNNYFKTHGGDATTEVIIKFYNGKNSLCNSTNCAPGSMRHGVACAGIVDITTSPCICAPLVCSITKLLRHPVGYTGAIVTNGNTILTGGVILAYTGLTKGKLQMIDYTPTTSHYKVYSDGSAIFARLTPNSNGGMSPTPCNFAAKVVVAERGCDYNCRWTEAPHPVHRTPAFYLVAARQINAGEQLVSVFEEPLSAAPTPVKKRVKKPTGNPRGRPTGAKTVNRAIEKAAGKAPVGRPKASPSKKTAALRTVDDSSVCGGSSPSKNTAALRTVDDSSVCGGSGALGDFDMSDDSKDDDFEP
jgi:hypothetical protein